MSSVLALPWWRGPRSAHAGLGLQGWLRCGRGGPGPGRAGCLLWSAWYLICSTTPAFVLGALLSCAVRTGWPHSGRTRPAPAGGPPRGAQVRSRPQAGVLCTEHAAATPADRRSSPKRGPRVSGALPSGDRQRSAVAPQGQRTRSGTYAAKPDGGNSLGEKTEFAPFCSPCAFPAHVLHAPFGCFTLPLQHPRLGPVSESPGARGEQRVLGRPRRVRGKRPGEDPGICTVKCVKRFPRAKLHSPPT